MGQSKRLRNFHIVWHISVLAIFLLFPVLRTPAFVMVSLAPAISIASLVFLVLCMSYSVGGWAEVKHVWYDMRRGN